MTFPDTLPTIPADEHMRINQVLIANLGRLLGWSK